MLVAVPTINHKLITRRFGRLTEISFIEIAGNAIIRQYSTPVTPHGHDDEHNPDHHQHDHGHHHHGHGHHEHNERHDEILAKISKADLVLVNSICRNWHERLVPLNIAIKRTGVETLEEAVKELELELSEQ